MDNDFNFSALLSDFFLKKGWVVYTAKDGQQAVNNVHTNDPDIILMNVDLPVRDGIATCNLLRRDIAIARQYPIIMMGAFPDKKKIVKSIEAGCDDFIVKPFKFDVLINKIEKIADFYRKKINIPKQEDGVDYKEEEQEAEIIVYSRNAVKKIFSNTMNDRRIEYPVVQKVVDNMVKILHRENNLPMAFKMKSYNDYIYIHSINVASLSMSFAYHLKWEPSDLQIVGEGGFLHDIGKTRIDLQILMKPDKLTDAEFSEMKKHPSLGRDILVKENITDGIQKIALEHHERINGSGYPNSLSGGQISKFGKLAAIIDAYDALTTDRCFKGAVDSLDALKIMSEPAGQFDQILFDKFADLIKNETIGK
ncbi:MAG: response regulator [Nitrospinae bacterium]|nr:response regulator [Nitrospinota bacterium]